jgi:hypothetical protein
LPARRWGNGLAHSLLGIPASKYFEDRKKYFRDGV